MGRRGLSRGAHGTLVAIARDAVRFLTQQGQQGAEDPSRSAGPRPTVGGPVSRRPPPSGGDLPQGAGNHGRWAINDTMRKFGYPETLLGEYTHWVVLLRPSQVTAGSLVLAHKGQAERLPDVSAEAFAELPRVTADLEGCLRKTFLFEKINYLLLMMVDKQIHWHVLPRYSGPREAAGATFLDSAWPGAPDVANTVDMDDVQLAALLALLRANWPEL